jgi:hypothetical protein
MGLHLGEFLQQLPRLRDEPTLRLRLLLAASRYLRRPGR